MKTTLRCVWVKTIVVKRFERFILSKGPSMLRSFFLLCSFLCLIVLMPSIGQSNNQVGADGTTQPATAPSDQLIAVEKEFSFNEMERHIIASGYESILPEFTKVPLTKKRTKALTNVTVKVGQSFEFFSILDKNKPPYSIVVYRVGVEKNPEVVIGSRVIRDERLWNCIRVQNTSGTSYRIELLPFDIEERGVEGRALPDEAYVAVDIHVRATILRPR